MLEFVVSNKTEKYQFSHDNGPIDLGRTLENGPGQHRINDRSVSGHQMRIEEIQESTIKVENLSTKVPVRFGRDRSIEPGGVENLKLPAKFSIGETLIEVESPIGGSLDTESLRTVDASPSRKDLWKKLDIESAQSSPDAASLAQWFERVVKIQRAVACSGEFYEEISRAVVELIGLDMGMVLLRKDERWVKVSDWSSSSEIEIGYSKTILDLVYAAPKTYYQDIDVQLGAISLAGVTSVVASPIFNSDESEVMGVVYGARRFRANLPNSSIQPLHAQLLQVLASAAGAGMARQKSEAEAARRHVQFELFFSRELAGELDRNPQLLEGQEREVTILCSDIRGFSRISERLGARHTFQLMNDVLERLTAQIHSNGGIVVDYAGDGIMAMWNAPVAQDDHAERACRAALGMLGELPALNTRWQTRINATLELGIGINTGEAIVGNTGSPQRLKYGPLGNSVNLASRVEGATKQLGVPILITGRTNEKLQGGFFTRRLCQVCVMGIENPVDLFELQHQTPDEDWIKARDTYETALKHYHAGNLSEACVELFPLIRNPSAGKLDNPSLTLIARAVEALRSKTEFDPVIRLDCK